MSPSDGPRVLCVAGDSGSGKTELLRRLLPRLAVSPERIGVVKHTHHAIDWHPPGKDSATLWDAGPAALCVAGPDQTAVFVRAGPSSAPRDQRNHPASGSPPDDGGGGSSHDEAADEPRSTAGGGEPEARRHATRRLVDACRRLPADTRLVLAEGFRNARAPKIWTADGPPPGALAPGVRAVVAPGGHVEAWREAHPEVEVRGRGEVDALAERVTGWAVSVAELPVG